MPERVTTVIISWWLAWKPEKLGDGSNYAESQHKYGPAHTVDPNASKCACAFCALVFTNHHATSSLWI